MWTFAFFQRNFWCKYICAFLAMQTCFSFIFLSFSRYECLTPERMMQRNFCQMTQSEKNTCKSSGLGRINSGERSLFLFRGIEFIMAENIRTNQIWNISFFHLFWVETVHCIISLSKTPMVEKSHKWQSLFSSRNLRISNSKKNPLFSCFFPVNVFFDPSTQIFSRVLWGLFKRIFKIFPSFRRTPLAIVYFSFG